MAVLQEINQSGTRWTDIWQCSTTKMSFFLEMFQWNSHQMFSFVCLFRGFVPLEIRHHYRWKLGSIRGRQSWSLSSEGSFACYTYCTMTLDIRLYGNLRWPLTLTTVAERLAVKLPLPFLANQICRERGLKTHFPHARRTLSKLIMSHSGGPNDC